MAIVTAVLAVGQAILSRLAHCLKWNVVSHYARYSHRVFWFNNVRFQFRHFFIMPDVNVPAFNRRYHRHLNVALVHHLAGRLVDDADKARRLRTEDVLHQTAQSWPFLRQGNAGSNQSCRDRLKFSVAQSTRVVGDAGDGAVDPL